MGRPPCPRGILFQEPDEETNSLNLMPVYLSMGHSSRGRSRFYLDSAHLIEAFTLVELLVTISIIAILVALTLPSLAGLNAAGKFNSAVSSISETLRLARETAVAHDTYVWVAFAITTSPNDPPLGTLVVASADARIPLPRIGRPP